MRLACPQLPGMAEYRLCQRHARYSALLWGALFWVQGPVPTLDRILSMWTIAVLMMVTLSIVAHSVPLACALFIAPVSLSAAAALTRAGAPPLAAVALVAGFLLCAFCIRFAPSHLRFRRPQDHIRRTPCRDSVGPNR